MTYPKPLSESNLKKLYASIGISEQVLKAVSVFFDVCSQLYGCISLGNAWDVYKTLMQEQGAPQIHRKDLYRYAEIAKRDVKPYKIIDDTEIWENGEGAVSWRMLINNDYLGSARSSIKFFSFYILYNEQRGKTFYIPDDFLNYLERPMIEEEKQLLKFMEGLKVTAAEVQYYNKTIKCEHKGQYLKDFKFYNESEKFEIEYFSGQLKERNARKTADMKMLKKIEENVCDNEAIKIVRILKDQSDTGDIGGFKTNVFKAMFDELNEVGVELTEKQLKELVKLAQNYVNKFHHRTNRGWAPIEMPRNYDPTIPPHIKIGPGIQEAINSGELDKDELIKVSMENGFILDFD